MPRIPALAAAAFLLFPIAAPAQEHQPQADVGPAVISFFGKVLNDLATPPAPEAEEPTKAPFVEPEPEPKLAVPVEEPKLVEEEEAEPEPVVAQPASLPAPRFRGPTCLGGNNMRVAATATLDQARKLGGCQ